MTGLPKLVLLDTAQLLKTEPPPLDWIVEGIAHRGSLSMIYGQEKQGKSMLLQAIAREMMREAGGYVAGLRVKPGTCMLIDAENGLAVIHRRLHLLDVPHERAGRLKPVVVGPGGFDLRRDLGLLEALMEEHKPDLVGLDSFRTLWDGDEDSSQETSPLLVAVQEIARAREASVTMIHHDGTNERKAGRGSTAIPAVAETNVRLQSMRDDPDPKRRKLHSVTRLDDDRTVWLRIAADTGTITIEETEPFGEDAAAARPSRKDPDLLARIRDVLTTRYQPVKDIAVAVDHDPRSKTVRNYLVELSNRGDAEKGEFGGWRSVYAGVPTPTPPYTGYTGYTGGGSAYAGDRANGHADPSMLDGLEDSMVWS